MAEVGRPTEKKCNKCNTKKSIYLFGLDKSKKDKHRTICKDCTRLYSEENKELKQQYRAKMKSHRVEYNRKYRVNNRDRQKDTTLKRIYGITIQVYNALLEAQGYTCAICRKSCQSGRALAVDHNHNTGKVRGLLCQKCNVAIGLLGDDFTLLTNAANYLYE